VWLIAEEDAGIAASGGVSLIAEEEASIDGTSLLGLGGGFGTLDRA